MFSKESEMLIDKLIEELEQAELESERLEKLAQEKAIVKARESIPALLGSLVEDIVIGEMYDVTDSTEFGSRANFEAWFKDWDPDEGKFYVSVALDEFVPVFPDTGRRVPRLYFTSYHMKVHRSGIFYFEGDINNFGWENERTIKYFAELRDGYRRRHVDEVVPHYVMDDGGHELWTARG